MEINKLAETVQRAQAGDADAQQELYIDSSKSVYFVALRLLKNPGNAEDIMQDVFLYVFENLPELTQPAAYYKWLNQITANKCMNFLRRNSPVSIDEPDILELLDIEDGDDETPESLFDDAETRRLILEIIDALPDAQRQSIILRYYSQFSIEEIAATMDTSENTVKSRLAIARRKIREAILEKEEKDGIRLHVVVPIMPVLLKALDEFQMPEGLMESAWQSISEGAGISATATSAGTSASTAATSGMAAGSKGIMTAILSVVGAAAVITAAVIFLPPLFDSSEPPPTPPGVTDNALPGVTDGTTPGTETPDATDNATPGTTETPGASTPIEESPSPTNGDDSDTAVTIDGGTYEGETDADGKFNGYGVWIYDNFRYEGHFADGVPNGQGTLYQTLTPPAIREPNHTYSIQQVLQGNFTDGFAHGTMTLIYHMELGDIHTWSFPINMGFSEVTEVWSSTSGANLTPAPDRVFGVPPWSSG